MEGYLYLKVGRSFVHTYVVLEGQQLQYYESVDVEKQKFKVSKGVQNILDVEVVPVKEPNRKFCLGILYPDGVITILDCEQRSMRKFWIDAIRDASLLHIKLHEIQSTLSAFRNRLGLHPDHMSSRAQIEDAYKIACIDAIKNAPHNPKNKRNYQPFDSYELIGNGTFDILNRSHRKGLDKETIQILHMAKEAKEALLIVEDDAYKRRIGTIVDYEVIIVKGRDGVGLGIEVEESEFLATPRLEVVGISDTLHVLGYTEEAQGTIKIGDVLIGIDHDNCADWPLSRVRARLGTLRLPPGHSTTLTFERVILTPKPPSWTPRDADKYNEYYSQSQFKQTQEQEYNKQSNKVEDEEKWKKKEKNKQMKEKKKENRLNNHNNNHNYSNSNGIDVNYDQDYQHTLNSLRHPLPQDVQDRIDATIDYVQVLSSPSTGTSTSVSNLPVGHGSNKVALNLSHIANNSSTDNSNNGGRNLHHAMNDDTESLIAMKQELANMRLQLSNTVDDIVIKQSFDRQRKEEEHREYESRIKRLNIRIASLEHMLAKESLLNVVSTIDSVTNPQDQLINRLKQHEQEQKEQERKYKEILAYDHDQMSQMSESPTFLFNNRQMNTKNISNNSSSNISGRNHHRISWKHENRHETNNNSNDIGVEPELMYDWLEEDEDVDQLSYMVNEEKIVNIAESALRAGAVQQIKELKVVSAGATSTGDIRPVVRPLQSPTAPSTTTNTKNTINNTNNINHMNHINHTTTDRMNPSFNLFDSPHRYSQKKRQHQSQQYRPNQEGGVEPITLYRL